MLEVCRPPDCSKQSGFLLQFIHLNINLVMETPYEIIEVIPLFDCRSLCILAFNTELQKETKHSISFLEFALAYSPNDKGKILVGQMQYHEDADTGPSSDIGESTIEVSKFIEDLLNKECPFNDPDAQLMKQMFDDVIIQILTNRLIHDLSGLTTVIN
jgi:hypothetical protein